MKQLFAALVLTIAACFATDKPSNPSVPEFPRNELQAEIARIEPLLAWKDQWPCAMGLDGFCSNGDGFIGAGELATVGEWPSDFQAGAFASIAENGKPYRSASHLADPNLDASSTTFSRDQALGLILLAKTYPNLLPLAQKVFDYSNAHDGRMCDDGGACIITPPLRIEWRHVLGENTNGIEQTIFEVTLLGEAKTTKPGYPQHLVSLDAWFLILSGHNSKNVREVTKILAQRMPNNLWFSVLKKISNGETDYIQDGISLLECMRQWQKPGLHHTWSSSRESGVCETRSEGAMGHELVWLAKLLTGDRLDEYARSSLDIDN